jgi:hypothetical protein
MNPAKRTSALQLPSCTVCTIPKMAMLSSATLPILVGAHGSQPMSSCTHYQVSGCTQEHAVSAPVRPYGPDTATYESADVATNSVPQSFQRIPGVHV